MNTPAINQLIANLHPDDIMNFEERAAIMEHMGGLSMDEAEKLALAEVMGKMIKGERNCTAVQS